MLWSVVLAACLASTTLAQRGLRHQRKGKKACESGNCTLLNDCPPVVTIIENARRNNISHSNLRSLICGFEKDQSKVCCPITNIEENDGGVDVLPSEPNCGLSDNIDYERVIGGKPATLGQWPWVALLGYKNRRSNSSKINWYCGGTLITQRHVLTAAHCLSHPTNILEKVRLGDLDINDSIEDGATPIERFIKQLFLHEEYNSSKLSNDIGIIKLDRPVTFTRQIQPICLPTTPELKSDNFERKTPFLAGWGQTEFKGPSVTHLQQVQFGVVNNTLCGDIYKRHNTEITSTQLCAGTLTGGKDSCQGDSGGPLMIPKRLHFYHIGIVSFGYKCGEVGYPGVYTRTTEYIDWISAKIKI